jgi:hypothetical protein
MSLPMHQNRKLGYLFLLPLLALVCGQGLRAAGEAGQLDMERIVGNQIENAVQIASWKADKPQQTNLFIYSAQRPKLDEALLRRVAGRFSLTGQVKQISGDTMGHVGYAIKEANPPVPAKPRSVFFWVTMGNFGYETGDDGDRFNPATKTHEVRGVPEKEDAKQEALKLLPVLGLSTNDLEHYPNGRIRWASSPKSISYTDKEDKKRKTLTIARNVAFFQRVPGGGTTTGVGDAGQLRFTFVSERKVANIEWFFRSLHQEGQAKPKTIDDITRDLAERNAYTWNQSVPSSIAVTNCVLSYPQGNSWLDQKEVWPFYKLDGVASDGRAISLFIPLSR